MTAHVRLQGVSLQLWLHRNRSPLLKEVFLRLLHPAPVAPRSSGFWALKDVDLELSAGDRLGVVGRNGAGKSTLLRVIAGIYPPTAGSIWTRGFVVPLLQVGVGFNYELSARENIIQSGAILGIPRRVMTRRIDSILAFAELGEYEDVPLKYFSSGMVARLGFTTATEVSPEILLLDEALSAGDAGFAEKAYRRIEELIDRTQIVIIVDHNMGSIKRLCNRAIWIRKGGIAASGQPEEVVAEYLAATKEMEKAKSQAKLA